jgi:hypothetical protein
MAAKVWLSTAPVAARRERQRRTTTNDNKQQQTTRSGFFFFRFILRYFSKYVCMYIEKKDDDTNL